MPQAETNRSPSRAEPSRKPSRAAEPSRRAAVPPPGYFGGWACFLVALVFIGFLTALIGDLASHMGCCMGLKASVTAITFVALGTSLPDTFASRSAAASEPYADASIVNITGSNSVNVFLGLGLPWMVAAIYWAFNGTHEEGMWRKRYNDEPWYNSDYRVGFAVPAGDLAYSVQVFVCTSLVCLGVLHRDGFDRHAPKLLRQRAAPPGLASRTQTSHQRGTKHARESATPVQ